MLIGIIIMTVISITSYIQSEPEAGEIRFIISEGNSLVRSTSRTNEGELIGKVRTFYGRLEDTGQLNIFHAYSFNGEIAVQKTYYLKQRILKIPHSHDWYKIVGQCYSPVDGSPTGYYIDVKRWERLFEKDSWRNTAAKTSCEWVKKNRKNFDLNSYKNTDRFKTTFHEFQDMDLNEAEFQRDDSLIFIDYERKIAGFQCGRIKMREIKGVRGDFLTFFAIYDFANMKLVKVLIKNTGYFLEH